MGDKDEPHHTYDDIFARTIGIYTLEMRDVIRNGVVAIGGVGGPGAQTALILARSGLGHLKIADPDVFEVHNINRQPGAYTSTIGRSKVEVLEELCKDINPHINVKTYPEGVRQNNVDEFVSNADVVVDAIDYTSPKEKLTLYRKAREAGLYVVSSPITGFGSLVFCFSPQGMKVEEAFGFPEDAESIADHRIPPEKLIGCTLDYVANDFFEIVESGAYSPTHVAACDVASAAAAIDIIKILLLREREQNPAAFPHLGEVPLTVVPSARRYDLWDITKDQIVDLRNLGGS